MTEPEAQPLDTIAQLEAAYRVGDFARVRSRARAILAQPVTHDPQTLAAIRAFAERVSVDPLAAIVIGGAALLFSAIVARYAF